MTQLDRIALTSALEASARTNRGQPASIAQVMAEQIIARDQELARLRTVVQMFVDIFDLDAAAFHEVYGDITALILRARQALERTDG